MDDCQLSESTKLEKESLFEISLFFFPFLSFALFGRSARFNASRSSRGGNGSQRASEEARLLESAGGRGFGAVWRLGFARANEALRMKKTKNKNKNN
jgi:hypothetical protein